MSYVNELEASLASHRVYIATLEDKIKNLEEVLYSVYKGERIAPWFGVECEECAGRCKVWRKEREFVFTKAELLEAIENIQKDSVT